MMKKLIRDYLTFNKRERGGILFLLGLLSLLVIAQPLISLLPGPPPPDHSEFKAEIERYYAAVARVDSLEAAERKQARKSFEEHQKPKKRAVPKPSYFPFDPNQLVEEEWKKLGLQSWQVRIIHNYLDKGGQFRKKSDLERIYGIDSALYANLEPYIQLPDTLPRRVRSKPWRSDKIATKKKVIQPFYLNDADTLELQQLKGIGKVFSKRIVTYREKLGGFYAIEQLHEVFGMDSVTIASIQPFLIVDSLNLRKMNINTVEAKTLQAHPYIRWNLAKVIVAYRIKHGPYKKVADVQKTDLVNAELYSKIAPYLAVSKGAY